MPKTRLTDEIREYFRKFGKYGALGGRAAAAKLTPEELSERGRRMVAARKNWILTDAERARRAKAKAKAAATKKKAAATKKKAAAA